MTSVRKKYIHNLAWSTTEAVIFQTFLLIHQFMMFKVTESYFYGLMGSLFGIIYLLVKLFDLGLNKTLISFYTQCTVNKKTFTAFLKKQLLPNFIFYIVGIGLLFLVKIFFISKIPFLASFDYPLIIIASGLVATESIKTVFKRLLQLSHNFRAVAFFEIAFIICYQIVVWSYYWHYHTFSLFFIFSTCFILSLCEAIGLFILTMRWYKTLPTNSLPIVLHNKTIIKNRLFIYGHSIGKQLFSANMLVPVFAYSFGFEYAALLKFASYITHALSTIVEKILDPASATLFAHTKNDDGVQTEELFAMASTVANHVIICSFIFIIVNMSKLMTMYQLTSNVAPYIVLYFLIHYGENFFITIEKFYIAQKRSEFILISTAITSILAIGMFFYSLSPLSSLLFLLLSRVLSFFALLVPLSYLWNIKPALRILPHYFLGSLFISLIFFFTF